ncbi:MAG TPA: DUF4336 domain-containing protein [Gammaproteobacteria bacterium]
MDGSPTRGTYPPLCTPKAVTTNVWIVDGPEILFGMPWPKMPFPTRTTVIRLDGGDLFVHSPTPLTDDLRAQIAAIGTVRHIVGPNRIHYWWIPEWHRAYPDAEVWLAPRIREQAGDHIDFPGRELDSREGYPWDEAIDTLPIAGSFMTEVEFFHRASRTLVLTDLIENFEPHKLRWPWRWLARAGGVTDPDGKMPRDMRWTFSKYKPQLEAAVEKMIEWDPERVILAHGRWYERDGAAELRRAFRWVLG